MGDKNATYLFSKIISTSTLRLLIFFALIYQHSFHPSVKCLLKQSCASDRTHATQLAINMQILEQRTPRTWLDCVHRAEHGLRTPRQKIAFTARPKIKSLSQIYRYGRSILCLPNRPKISGFFDLCIHLVSVVRGAEYLRTNRSLSGFNTGTDLA